MCGCVCAAVCGLGSAGAAAGGKRLPVPMVNWQCSRGLFDNTQCLDLLTGVLLLCYFARTAVLRFLTTSITSTNNGMTSKTFKYLISITELVIIKAGSSESGAVFLSVLALLFLTLIPWPGPSVFKITCSRDNSKIVRKVIQNKWLPVLERFQVKLPLECPFHPARDIFAPQHDAKMQHRPSQWTCAFCGKSFYEERHLDTHFDQRHKNQINRAEDAVCLAEYCDIMRCQVLVAHGLLNGGGGPSTDMEVWQDAEAARKALAPAAPRSVARVPARRRRPRAIQPHPVDCPSTDVDPDIAEREEKRTEDSEGDANQTSELCDADTVESSLPPDSRQRRLADLQAERAACDPARLQILKVRCERVVHSCIATLLLHLTQHQFTELEDEMQRAVCWYLSCDRYWEDTAPTARVFPWPLLLALATGLALALCMCYYIIWIVFDSEEGSVAGSASVSMTTHSSPARAERLAGEEALLDDPDHDDQYIYVTYPPELKRRLLESCYNRTTRL